MGVECDDVGYVLYVSPAMTVRTVVATVINVLPNDLCRSLMTKLVHLAIILIINALPCRGVFIHSGKKLAELHKVKIQVDIMHLPENMKTTSKERQVLIYMHKSLI